jgi:hypothetical protein
VALIVLAIIVLYHFVVNNLLPNHEDFLNRKVLDINLFGENGISWWPITHFIFFFVLGVLFPKCWLVIIFIAVLFEVIEETGCHFHRLWTGKKYQVELDPQKYQYHHYWMCGTLTDIFADMLGMICGIGLGKLLGKQCNHPVCYSPIWLYD